MGRPKVAELDPEALAQLRAKRRAEPRLSMAELEVKNPERAARRRAYDRMRQKRNLADPIRAEKIRANDRERHQFRNIPTMAEIVVLDPAKAARIRARESRKRQRLRTDPATRARYMRQAVKDEARRKGVKFEISLQWFEDRLTAGICEMSGLGFDLERNGRGTPKPNAPSVDRKIAGGDYTESNCRMILFSINQAMSNWGEEYTLNVFRRVLATRG